MDKFAIRPEQERRDVLRETAGRRDLAEIIIEKDFWVCWTLKRLFSNPALSPLLTFKGGTSLSKAYGLIERFSEDIDLTISRQAPCLSDGKDPMESGISGNERSRRIETLKQNARLFVENVVLPALETDIQAELGGADTWKIMLDVEDPDRQTLLFYYPKVFNYELGTNFSNFTFDQSNFAVTEYIKPHIKLEFGARGETEPHETRTVISYAAETFPDIFDDPSHAAATLAVERTFWEKATILHALHHGSKMRDRMSRHYYDTYMLARKELPIKLCRTQPFWSMSYATKICCSGTQRPLMKPRYWAA